MTTRAVTIRRTRSLLRGPTVGRLSGRTALAALVTALVVGILGMHALAGHGTPAVSSAAASMTGMGLAHEAAMASGSSHDDHAHAAAHTTGKAAAETGADSSSGSGHGMGSMVMLCVVMLATAALTLLVLLAVGIFRPLLPAAFKPALVCAQAQQWVRGTGPPPEWQFSVIRC